MTSRPGSARFLAARTRRGSPRRRERENVRDKKRVPSLTRLTRVNREQDIPLPDPSENRQVLQSPTPSNSSWGPSQDSLVSLRLPPLHPFSLASASHVPQESHLAGSILLHSRRGLSPKDGQLYKRDARCLKHVRRNRTGASSRPR